MRVIPENFARTMEEVNGQQGIVWLQGLPEIIADCERRWNLTVGPPFEPLSYNYVAPAVCSDGVDVVLKVGFPGRELFAEIEALRLYDGHGIVRLLAADDERGAFLLERLKPGVPLSQTEDDQAATSVAVQVMRELWRPVPAEHPFPAVADWAAGLERLRKQFDGGTGPFPPDLVAEAEQLFAELIASMAEPVLLHGDLHHDNILTSERRPWLALDPKGIVGEPAYEVGALLRNRLPPADARAEVRRVLGRRVDQFAEELGVDRERILGWGLAQAVLSGWWSFEDHGYGWEEALVCAEILGTL